jgi:heme/copper-type cytochrome/quinol oxidase subunit 2
MNFYDPTSYDSWWELIYWILAVVGIFVLVVVLPIVLWWRGCCRCKRGATAKVGGDGYSRVEVDF